MSYYRVQYQNCLEGKFKNSNEAVEEFIEQLRECDLTHIRVEEWLEDKQKWCER